MKKRNMVFNNRNKIKNKKTNRNKKWKTITYKIIITIMIIITKMIMMMIIIQITITKSIINIIKMNKNKNNNLKKTKGDRQFGYVMLMMDKSLMIKNLMKILKILIRNIYIMEVWKGYIYKILVTLMR